jgi:ketosteroid isomerase-like protein
MDDTQRKLVEAAVREAMEAFERAERGLDADALIATFAPVPEFHIALATGTFRESTTDAAGTSARVRGAASWLWREIDGRWRIVYGHADHYPDVET